MSDFTLSNRGSAPFLLLFTACVLTSNASAGTGAFLQQLEQGQHQTIVVYGTSLTAGGAWVSQMSSFLNSQYPGQVRLVNSGLSGKASNSGVANLQAQVLSKNADAVFIEFSMNDSFTAYEPGNIDEGITLQQARNNLESMIDDITSQNAGVDIILQTMNPAWDAPNGNMSGSKRALLPDYYQMYRDVADERGLTLIDNNHVWTRVQTNDVSEFSSRVSDGTHPDSLGYQRYVTPAVLYGVGANIGPCLVVDLETGSAILHNQSEDDTEIISYTISSTAGALLTDWAGLSTNQPIHWQKANPTSLYLSEIVSTADAPSIAAGEAVELGTAWDTTKSLNLQFKYQTVDGVVHNSYVVFLNDTASLTAVAGDYNGDGIVNLADYTVWRDTLGATGPGLAADGDGSETVDELDYDLWKENLGFGTLGVVSTLGTVAVPDPTTLASLVAGLCLFALQTRRRAA